ncbi:hypothetical protein O181_098777 [Austropuccinia psidii MF-1]|uniref:Uncharacterized protein n=1 Tax=Austropuccinia psidii MF-1 TaxID=1389203 RepID=A0A9Q3JB30_9BASI|nr:hypothetical protein [Austropuccinia psidii MF-1]
MYRDFSSRFGAGCIIKRHLWPAGVALPTYDIELFHTNPVHTLKPRTVLDKRKSLNTSLGLTGLSSSNILAFAFPAPSASSPFTYDNDLQEDNGHTLCYNYFLEKDKCVYGAANETERCDETTGKPRKTVSQGAFRFQNPTPTLPNYQPLVRRYNTQNDSNSRPIESGPGICGDYDTNTFKGVCLWSGPMKSDGSNPAKAGWLNGARSDNCYKRIYIQREGNPNATWYAEVIDGCTFYLNHSSDACMEIAFTEATFNEIGPSPEEKTAGALYGILWDFDNLPGKNCSGAPT